MIASGSSYNYCNNGDKKVNLNMIGYSKQNNTEIVKEQDKRMETPAVLQFDSQANYPRAGVVNTVGVTKSVGSLPPVKNARSSVNLQKKVNGRETRTKKKARKVIVGPYINDEWPMRSVPIRTATLSAIELQRQRTSNTRSQRLQPKPVSCSFQYRNFDSRDKVFNTNPMPFRFNDFRSSTTLRRVPRYLPMQYSQSSVVTSGIQPLSYSKYATVHYERQSEKARTGCNRLYKRTSDKDPQGYPRTTDRVVVNVHHSTVTEKIPIILSPAKRDSKAVSSSLCIDSEPILSSEEKSSKNFSSVSVLDDDSEDFAIKELFSTDDE